VISTEELIKLRGYYCEECGKPAYTLQRHHWLFKRDKRFSFLNDERNLGLVCLDCHENVSNSYESKKRFFLKQCKRYTDMKEWLANLPLKFKQTFE
jgi:hypothetical protein